MHSNPYINESGRICLPRKFVNESGVTGIRDHIPGIRLDMDAGEWRIYLDENTLQKINSVFNCSLSMPKEPTEKIAYPFKTDPYDHQHRALAMDQGREAFGYWMTPGTGKTKVTIDRAQIESRDGNIDGVVIVCPKSIISTWINEINIHGHGDDWNIHYWDEGIVRSVERSDNPSLEWFIINYDALIPPKGKKGKEAGRKSKGYSATEKFMIGKMNVMMCGDELTVIKNFTSLRTQACISLGHQYAKMRRGLTGTPVANTPLDLYSQLFFLSPDLVDGMSYEGFKREFCIMGGYKGKQVIGFRNKERLRAMLKAAGIIIRLDDVVDLPPVIECIREIELKPKTLKLYDALCSEVMVELEEGNITAGQVLPKLIKTRQICGGFIKGDDGVIIKAGTEKLDETKRIIAECSGRQGLIWCQFRAEIDAIEEMIAKMGLNVATMTGDDNTTTLLHKKAKFQEGGIDWLICQNDTGSMGHNLTTATVEIFYSNSIKPVLKEQAGYRVHRIGQRGTVTRYELICPGTIDESNYQLLQNKQGLADFMMGFGGDVYGEISGLLKPRRY